MIKGGTLASWGTWCSVFFVCFLGCFNSMSPDLIRHNPNLFVLLPNEVLTHLLQESDEVIAVCSPSQVKGSFLQASPDSTIDCDATEWVLPIGSLAFYCKVDHFLLILYHRLKDDSSTQIIGWVVYKADFKREANFNFSLSAILSQFKTISKVIS